MGLVYIVNKAEQKPLPKGREVTVVYDHGYFQSQFPGVVEGFSSVWQQYSVRFLAGSLKGKRRSVDR